MKKFALYFALQTFLRCVYSYTQLRNIIPSIIKRKDIYRDLSLIIQDKKYDTYIINDSIFNNQHIKKDFTKLIFEDNLISFKELTFNEFMIKKPHLFSRNTAFYINDYLIKDGRILNEEEKLSIQKKNSNYVLLQVNDMDIIPIKDNHFNKKIRILNFPVISKKDVVNYIYELIEYFHYNEYLYLVDWNSFDIDKLNFSDIHILLDKIEKYYFKYNTINTVNTVNLNNINQKNLDKYIMTIINILQK
jgi:hypothetical protein